MLALAFLVLIGMALVADGFEFHIPRGYIYFAMAFAAAVETVQRAGAAQPRARRPGRAARPPDGLIAKAPLRDIAARRPVDGVRCNVPKTTQSGVTPWSQRCESTRRAVPKC